MKTPNFDAEAHALQKSAGIPVSQIPHAEYVRVLQHGYALALEAVAPIVKQAANELERKRENNLTEN